MRFYLVILICFCFISCKKKTDITVEVRDVGINKAMVDAEVQLHREVNKSGWFGPYVDVEILQKTKTDNEGNARFQTQKLENKSGYRYFVVCKQNGAMENDFKVTVDKEKKEQKIKISVITYGNIQIKYSNLFVQAVDGDYICVKANNYTYTLTYPANNFLPTEYIEPGLRKVQSGYSELRIDKMKLGIESTEVRNVWVDPGKTVTETVNW